MDIRIVELPKHLHRPEVAYKVTVALTDKATKAKHGATFTATTRVPKRELIAQATDWLAEKGYGVIRMQVDEVAAVDGKAGRVDH